MQYALNEERQDIQNMSSFSKMKICPPPPVVRKSAIRGACGGKRRAALIAHLALGLAFCAQAAFAQAGNTNHQKIHPIDSEVYQVIKSLYISRGLALPSTTGPWSEAELLLMLGRIDSAALSPGEQAAYDYAERELNKEHSFARFSFEAAVEARGHTNTEEFTRQDDYMRLWHEAKPLFDINFEGWITPYAYGFTGLSIGNFVYNKTTTASNGGNYISSPFFGARAFSTNIWMVPPSELNYLDFNFPSRAFVAVGGSGWNLVAGRDRLSWGNGESGNFVVGSQLEYHDSIRTSWFNDHIKYTFNVSRFPWVGEYYLTDTVPGYDDYAGSVFDPASDATGDAFQGISLFVAHRVEWRAWKNKLNFAFTESIMYENPNGSIDPLIFSPTLFLHNMYKAYSTNSIIAFEADYTIIPALNVYGQFVLDESTLPGEPVPGEDNYACPDGLGYLIGAKTAFPLSLAGTAGMFSASLEGAYTTPYLYLRSKLQKGAQYGDEQGDYPLGYVAANRYISTSGNSNYAEDFLGYRWGGDAIVLNANAGYQVFGQWNAKANLMVMIHGTHDKWTYWSRVYLDDDEHASDAHNVSTPTTEHQTSNAADSDVSDRNAASVTTALSLLGSWNLPWVKGLSVYGQGDFIYVVNKDNVEGKSASDLQFTLGVSYKF
jgi:hypothetical protein